MTEAEEKAYIEGEKAFARRVLSLALGELREDGADRSREAMISERSTTLAMLRREIERVGGGEVSEDLHLHDVIEKHLLRPLWDRIERAVEFLGNDRVLESVRIRDTRSWLEELLP